MDARESGGGSSCAFGELLPDLLEFLGQDLEREDLTAAVRERQRCLLQQVSLLRIAQCGGPSHAAVLRRQHHQLLASTAAAASSPQAAAGPPASKQLDPRSRMSLPAQAFANLGFTFDKHEATEASVYETPLAMDAEDPVLLPSKRRPLAAAVVAGAAAAAAGAPADPAAAAAPAAPSMSGPLRHRHEEGGGAACRWQRFPSCALVHGCRLLCYKSGRAAAPALTLQLAGYTALYVSRESQASHVVKLTHPSLRTHALAADTESEARAWVARVNWMNQRAAALQHWDAGAAAGPAAFGVVAAAGGGFEEPDSGFSGPVSSSSTDSYDQQQPPLPQVPPAGAAEHARLTKSASFTPGFAQADVAAAMAASHSRQHSGGGGGGFMRRFRDSFGAGSGGGSSSSGSRRRQQQQQQRAAVDAAAVAVPAPDSLVHGEAEVRLAGSGQWRRCLVQFRLGGRLCLPGVSPEPLLVDDRLRLMPLEDDLPDLRQQPHRADSSGGGQPAVVVRRRRHRRGVCGFRLATAAGEGATVVELRGFDKLALGDWVKQLALATGMAPQYEPIAAQLLDLSAAREIVNSRRASMPEPRLARLAEAAAAEVALRPLPPVPDGHRPFHAGDCLREISHVDSSEEDDGGPHGRKGNGSLD